MANDNLSFLTNLQIPKLDNSRDIVKWMNDVNNNFIAISSLPFLRGDHGLSIYTQQEALYDKDWTPLGNCIRELIYHLDDHNTYNDVPIDIRNIFENGDEGIEYSHPLKEETITVNVDDYDGTKYFTVPFTFLDPRRNDILNVYQYDEEGNRIWPVEFTDYSCTLVGTFRAGEMPTSQLPENTIRYEDVIVDNIQGEIKGYWEVTRFHLIPTLYYDDQVGQFCWRVNGEDSHIIAQGVKGERGKDAVLHMIEGDLDGNKIPIDQGKYPDVEKDDVVMVIVTKPDGTKDIVFGIVKEETNGDLYIDYDAGSSIIQILSKFQLREALNEIGENKIDDSLKGLYIPSTDGENHMVWDENGTAHIGKVDYEDTKAKTDTPTPRPGDLQVDYDTIKTNTIESTNKNKDKVVIGSKGQNDAPIIIDKSKGLNNHVVNIDGKKTDLDLSEIPTNSQDITSAKLTFVPSFEFTIYKTSNQFTNGKPITTNDGEWTIQLPYLGYIGDTTVNTGDVPIYNVHQFTTLTGNNYIKVKTKSSTEILADGYNVNTKVTSLFKGSTETNIVCYIDDICYRCSISIIIIEGPSRVPVKPGEFAELKYNESADVFIYIKPYNKGMSHVWTNDGDASTIGSIRPNSGYTWSNIDNGSIENKDLYELIFAEGNVAQLDPPTTNPNIVYPFMHFKVYGGGVENKPSYGKLFIIDSFQGNGTQTPADSTLAFPGLTWNRLTVYPTDYTVIGAYDNYVCPPSPRKINGVLKGDYLSISDYPHIIFKKEDTKYVHQSGYILRQTMSNNPADSGFAISTRPSDNKVKTMTISAAGQTAQGITYKLFPQGSLFVDDFPVVLDLSKQNKVSYGTSNEFETATDTVTPGGGGTVIPGGGGDLPLVPGM